MLDHKCANGMEILEALTSKGNKAFPSYCCRTTQCFLLVSKVPDIFVRSKPNLSSLWKFECRSPILNFTKIRPVGAKLIYTYAGKWVDRRIWRSFSWLMRTRFKKNQSSSWEATSSSARRENPSPFLQNPKIHYRVHKISLWSLHSARLSQLTPSLSASSRSSIHLWPISLIST